MFKKQFESPVKPGKKKKQTGSTLFHWQNLHRQLLWWFGGVTFGVCHSSCKDKLIGLSSWFHTFLASMLHQFSLKMKSWSNITSPGTHGDDLIMIKRQLNFLMSICFPWNLFRCSQNWWLSLVDNWLLFTRALSFKNAFSQRGV